MRRLNQVAQNQQGADKAERLLQSLLAQIAARVPQSKDALQAEFRAVDANGSGLISHNELKAFLQKYNLSLTDEEVKVGLGVYNHVPSLCVCNVLTIASRS